MNNAAASERPTPVEAFTITVAQTFEEVAALRPLWQPLQRRLNHDLDHFLFVTGHVAGAERPFVVIVSSAEGRKALMIGRIDKAVHRFKIAHKILFSTEFLRLTIIRHGLLGVLTADIATRLIDELVLLRDRHRLDMVVFNGVDTQSDLYAAIKQARYSLIAELHGEPWVHWTADLPPSIDAYFERLSAKSLKRNKSYWRAFTRENPEFSIRCFAAAEEMDDFCGEIEGVAAKTHVRQLGQGFRDSEFVRRYYAFLAGNGHLRGYVLYANATTPVAFWIILSTATSWK